MSRIGCRVGLSPGRGRGVLVHMPQGTRFSPSASDAAESAAMCSANEGKSSPVAHGAAPRTSYCHARPEFKGLERFEGPRRRRSLRAGSQKRFSGGGLRWGSSFVLFGSVFGIQLRLLQSVRAGPTKSRGRAERSCVRSPICSGIHEAPIP